MKYRKHIAAGIVLAILFSIYIATHRHAENTTITATPQKTLGGIGTPHSASRRVRFQSSTHPNEDMELKHFQNSDFYHTIIDNNLFRPLGWTPPRPQEPYRLLGTIIPIDAKSVRKLSSKTPYEIRCPSSLSVIHLTLTPTSPTFKPSMSRWKRTDNRGS